jgi:hypothetical protein
MKNYRTSRQLADAIKKYITEHPELTLMTVIEACKWIGAENEKEFERRHNALLWLKKENVIVPFGIKQGTYKIVGRV